MATSKSPKGSSSGTKATTKASYSKGSNSSKTGKKKWKDVSREIYELNGHLMKLNNLAGKIARDEQVYSVTRNNAKYLLSLLKQVRKNFWGPLTWNK